MLKKTEYTFPASSLFDLDFSQVKTTINQPTGNFFYDPWIIKPEFKGTVWEDLLESLPFPKGEARVIKLSNGTTYMAHADIDDRWHYSIQGQESYLIDLSDQQMHKLEQDGVWWEMDAGKIHVASNFGSIDRLQIVVRKLLIPSDSTNLISVTLELAKERYDIRYLFDNNISPWLNRANKEKVMKDFTVFENKIYFKLDKSALPSLENILTDDFKISIQS